MKKQSFITGAVILMAANAVSKILGAVLKIPLAYILNEEGMAVYNIAFEVYIMFLSFIISGLPFAVSKLSAEAASLNKWQRGRQIVSVSTRLLVITGAAGSALLYFAAPFFAAAMKETKAVFAIRMISPSVFFVALGMGYRSYFQGVSRMVPVAISQVSESFVKLAAGYGFAVLFLNFGAEKTAGGAVLGVTAGEITQAAILAFAYIFSKKEVYIKQNKESSRTILCELLSLALPLLCASVVSNALGVADTTLTRTRLIDAGLGADRARFLYGAYTGYALTVFHLPVGILATLGVSILPLIAGAYASGNTKKAQKSADFGLRISILLSIPCAVMMYAQSSEILHVLFHNTNSALMLKTVAPCAVLMCAAQMCAAVLQSAGKIMTPFYNSLAGMAVKIALGYFLIGNPDVNIYGSAISAIAAYFVILILNIIAIRRQLGVKTKISAALVKPLICGAAMYGVIYIIAPYTAHFGSLLSLAITGGVSLGVYTLLLLLTQTVSIKEIKSIKG
ncbi:MAG: polysaccharide biosynthesis protein [Clostridia bacterium]|nr:polysaccharide biosynthesis protein [Clostridia bacterium]